ncbi:MAG TPA: zinc-binding dehydrogenase [Candidatus Nitrosotenuis sp.]|nr:zinc-binding dehydrogenase [Candidatus Nitrosotenuis sp.]
MKAVRIHQHGGPEVLRLEEIPPPRPAPGQVLVRIRAASVNHLDLFVRRGMPGIPVEFPRILGSDAAGEVLEDGGGWKAGDRVLVNPGSSCGRCRFCVGGDPSMCPQYRILGEHLDGTYTQQIALPPEQLLPLPEGLSFEQGAALPLVFMTAWRMLVSRGRLRPGEVVVVLGAGSGVGSACVQIARMAGCRVIATASSPEKRDKALALGADEVLDSRSPELARQVRRLTGGGGADVVVDYVGKDTWPSSLKALRNGGRLLTCGATTGYDAQTDLRHIFYRQLEVIGSTMGSSKDLSEVLEGVRRGLLRPVVDRVLPLEEAAEAHRLLAERRVFGKIVLQT